MATGSVAGLSERRFVESSSRPGRSPKPRGASLRHKPRSQHDVMKESEQSLHKLLEDFELGHLNAFGEDKETDDLTPLPPQVVLIRYRK